MYSHQDEWDVANSWGRRIARNSWHPRFEFPPFSKIWDSCHCKFYPFKVYNFRSQARIIRQRVWKTSAGSTLATPVVKPRLTNKLPIPSLLHPYHHHHQSQNNNHGVNLQNDICISKQDCNLWNLVPFRFPLCDNQPELRNIKSFTQSKWKPSFVNQRFVLEII